MSSFTNMFPKARKFVDDAVHVYLDEQMQAVWVAFSWNIGDEIPRRVLEIALLAADRSISELQQRYQTLDPAEDAEFDYGNDLAYFTVIKDALHSDLAVAHAFVSDRA